MCLFALGTQRRPACFFSSLKHCLWSGSLDRCASACFASHSTLECGPFQQLWRDKLLLWDNEQDSPRLSLQMGTECLPDKHRPWVLFSPSHEKSNVPRKKQELPDMAHSRNISLLWCVEKNLGRQRWASGCRLEQAFSLGLTLNDHDIFS